MKQLEQEKQEFIENSYLDAEVIEAGIEAGIELDGIEEAYNGEYKNDVEFAQELLESCGYIPQDLPPYIHIDWEWTAQEIMMDYIEQDGYYFRNF